MMKAEDLEYLLEKHHRKACSDDERKLLYAYIDQLNSGEIISIGKQERLLIQVKKRLDKQINQPIPAAKKVLPLWSKWAAAASAAVLFFCLYFIQTSPSPTRQQYTVIASSRTGQVKKVILSDGSTVWLNALSKLLIRPDFNTKQRDVVLIGEAFFEVTKNKQKPFIIHTGTLKTQVLGTSFNVQAYSVSEKIEVALKTGKVWMTEGKQQAILLPGEMISYKKSSRHLGTVKNMLDNQPDAWKTGKLIFNEVELQEVAERLNRAYDLDIRLKTKALQNRRIYGEFNIGQDPNKILDDISHLIGAHYTRNGRTVLFEY